MSKSASAIERFSRWATDKSGSAGAFCLAVLVIVIWLAVGPLFGLSDTWQLVINTGTTIITFLMVFLIQRAQNKDSQAVQLKLNEIVAALTGASNRLINVEDLSEEEVRALHRRYQNLAGEVQDGSALHESHSVEEADDDQPKPSLPAA